MATDREFVDHILDLVRGAGTVTARKMFGEYAIYVDGRVVGLVCDDRLFVKPTERGREFIGEVVEAPAYPGARPSFLVEDRLDDDEFLTELFRMTAEALPAPARRRRGQLADR